MGNRIAIMRSGKIEQYGTFDDIYYSPANLFIATFIGTPPISIIPVVIDNGTLILEGNDAIQNKWPLTPEITAKLPSGLVRMGVRPEGWQVAQPDGQGVFMNVGHIERLYTERAAFIFGQLAGALIAALVPLDYLEVKAIRLTPDWDRVYFFSADGEASLHVPGAPELF
jgi:ABC-type sugar transport system ATPase subunit